MLGSHSEEAAQSVNSSNKELYGLCIPHCALLFNRLGIIAIDLVPPRYTPGYKGLRVCTY